jgi:phage tail protein X
MTIYTTKAGDMLDAVVWNFYGRQDNRLVEITLEANRNLAELGPVLPAGIEITLPNVPAEEPTERLQLFS